MLDGGLDLIFTFLKVFVSTIVDTLKTLFGMIPNLIREMRKMMK